MNMLKVLPLVFALAPTFGAMAEDIEVYVGKSNANSETQKPKVLFILDNSGSMNEKIDTSKAYDPSVTYAADQGYARRFDDDNYVYYSIGGSIDDIAYSNSYYRKRFNSNLNGCDASKEAFAEFGYFSGKVAEFGGNSWKQMRNNNGQNMYSAVDCLADFQNDDVDNLYNSQALTVVSGGRTYTSSGNDNLKGYPSHANVSGHSPFLGYSGANPSGYSKIDMENAFDGAYVVTMYSANYLRWYVNREQVYTSKIEIAKEALRQTLGATQEVDFSLMLFNFNAYNENQKDGGRVVASFGVGDTDILNIVNSIAAETNTPLCETLFEGYNYLAGNNVRFGNDDPTRLPTMDFTATENLLGRKYISPFTDGGDCPSSISIIYITDGQPTLDRAADASVLALPNMATTTSTYGNLRVDGSYLPALAHWMHTNDINTSLGGDQTTNMYTVGFGDGAPEAILGKAAEAGGGKYFFANDGITLSDAIQESLNTILETSTSFTAPSVASNNFDRTQTSDSVYYAMFLPTEGARWAGNLKKLRVKGGKVVDANDVAALDAEGNIKSGADIVTTIWSEAPDGNDVRAGGANNVLFETGVGSRKVISNLKDGQLKELNLSNVVDFYGSEEDAASELSVSDEELENTIKWAIGYDVDDANNNSQRTDARTDIMGDPLHSRPVALSYPNGETKIILGTNAGFIHLFSDKNDTLKEQWAFIPNELLGNIVTLREDTDGEKVYGMDGTATVYFEDNNNDGVVDEGTDKVWMFMGMRRGGNSYYAFDLSNSDAPQLKWIIDSNTPGFEELGQSWSQPTLAYMKGGGDYPVLIFGAGYDTGKDYDPMRSDSQGRGVFIVKSDDGSLLGKFTNEASDGVYFPGNHGITGQVSAMDSNYDGLIDRLYATDTGGGVWRMDMPEGPDTWSVYQLADLSSAADTRRFFYGPSVARTYFTEVSTFDTTVDGKTDTQVIRQESPYEAVIVGSGNRSHPLEDSEQDYLFMIRDKNVQTKTFSDSEKPVPITINDLMDVTTSPFGSYEVGSDEFVNTEMQMSLFKGWKYRLGKAEKSLAEPSILYGVAYFSSFVPSSGNDLEQCVLEGGSGSLYAFNLHYGMKVYDSVKIDLGNKIPPSPTWVVEDKFYCLNCGNEPDPDGGNKETLLELKAINPDNPSETTVPSFRTIQNYIYRVEAGN